MWQIIEGDALDVLRGMADASVEAVVCDPPYELGFMGKHWDAAGIANNVEMWREVLRILKPGGHLFAFGGTRTYHRMTCAIEDAGFEIRDCVQWLYGSGFPKSHDIGKAIDKAAGAEREVVGIKPDPRYQYASKTPVFSSERRGYDDGTTAGVFSAGLSDASALTAPATPAAQQWDGWGTALKPAHEPIVLARKPIVGTVAANVQTYGTGALNIAAARVGTEEDVTRISGPHIGWGLRPGQRSEQPTGRWPANLVLSHAPGCVKVGTKRVKVDTGNTRHKLGADYNGKRGSTPNAPSSSLPTSAYADADGLETVDAWECVEGRSYATYEYAHSSGVLSPLDAPLFLLDRLASLLQAVREYSTNGNSLLRDACEVYRIERTRLAGPVDGLASEVAHALEQTELLSSLDGCPSCRRFCDERVHRVLTTCLEDAPSLPGVLAHVHSDLSQLAHSPHRQRDGLLSSSDDARRLGAQYDSHENNTSERPSLSLRLEQAFRIEDTTQRERGQSERLERTPENNTCGCDSRGTCRHNEGTSAAVRLLSMLSSDLAWRFILPAHIIQRREIVVNLGGCPVRALGEQSGERTTGSGRKKVNRAVNFAGGGWKAQDEWHEGDTGTAARFFTNLEPSPLDDVTPWLYTAKASRREREAGLEGMEERPAPTMSGGEFRNPLWDGARSNKEITARNPHPTVKPVALMRWLVKLITPPGGIVLDPFAGSGTTGIACVLDGFGFIGIEQDADYCEIARRRIAHWEREAMLTQPALLDMTGD